LGHRGNPSQVLGRLGHAYAGERGASRTTGGNDSRSLTGSAVSALRDFRAHQLGSAGERWVVDPERETLRRAGRPERTLKGYLG
jgi:hypothetical protein